MRETPFGEEELDRHDFLGGRVRATQPRGGFRSGSDAVLLAASVQAQPGDRVLDLGCGAGVASLCLAARVPGLELHGLELQPAYGALAERNAAAMGLDFRLYSGDVECPPRDLLALSFDRAMTNPPYFLARENAAASDPGRRVARWTVSLDPWIDCALRRLREGGWLALIQRAEVLGRLLALLEGRAGDIAIKPLAPKPGAAAKRVLIRARKGARAPLRLCAPLVLHPPDGQGYTPEADAILRHGEALDF